MPRIDVDGPLDADLLRSSMVYGVTRAGKTVLNATFPRPALLTSEREGGYRSVKTMDRALWYEPDMTPIVFAISSIKEFLGYLKEIEAAAKAGRIQTVVLELSFYSDDIIRLGKANAGKNQWAPYKLLDEHLQFFDERTKKLGLRVAYNALAADPGDVESKVPAGIQVAGKAIARKLPAAQDLTGYLRTEDRGGGKVDRVLHLTPYGVYPAGHRYGNKLPPIIRNPTFRKLEDLVIGRGWCDEQGIYIPGMPRPESSNGASSAIELEPISDNDAKGVGDLPAL